MGKNRVNGKFIAWQSFKLWFESSDPGFQDIVFQIFTKLDLKSFSNACEVHPKWQKYFCEKSAGIRICVFFNEKCKQKLETDTSLLQQNRMYGPWSIHIFSQWTAIMDSTRMNNMEENLIVIKDFQLLTGILDLFHPCR